MIRPALLLLLALSAFQEGPSHKEKKDYVDKNVDMAIEKGLRALRGLQQDSGVFDSTRPSGATHGVTALALYTLLASGGTLEDPAAAKALDWLLANPFAGQGIGRNDTYEISLIAVALSYSIPHLAPGKERDRAVAALQRSADWLMAAQARGGGWGYGMRSVGHDHSNSQFGILGLRAAANAGARVRKEVWEREVNHYRTSQLSDGGWGYTVCYKDQSRPGPSTSTMTAAGVMGLAIALGSTGTVKAERIAADAAIKRGLAAMRDHWKRGLTNELKPLGGVPYLLYSVERACMVTGQRFLGDIDWYVEGSHLLISEQSSEGMLGTGRDRLVAHCFSLLFLKRAFVPVATPSNTKAGGPVKSSGPDPHGGKPREME